MEQSCIKAKERLIQELKINQSPSETAITFIIGLL